MTTLSEVFPSFILSCKANARVKLAKTGRPALFLIFVVYDFMFCVVLRIDCVYMYSALLPPCVYPIAVNKYIISF
jgi:hypothetical protein